MDYEVPSNCLGLVKEAILIENPQGITEESETRGRESMATHGKGQENVATHENRPPADFVPFLSLK